MSETTLTAKSVRMAEDEAKWLSAAAGKGAVTQNDLIRLAVHRLRKPETIVATAKASKYKLTAPRTAASVASPAVKSSSRAANGKATVAKATSRSTRARAK